MNPDPVNPVPNQQIPSPAVPPIVPQPIVTPTIPTLPILPQPIVLPPSDIPVSSPPSSNSKIKMISIIGAGLLALIILVVLGAIFVPKFLGSKPGSSNSLTAIPSKYEADSDADNIPDEIETAVGFDPTVSEFSRCQPDTCGASGASQAAPTQSNILLVIDESGSMGELVGGISKIDLAKDAIRNFLKSVEPNVSVGIMVYGNKGSNSPSDKPLSCSSAELIAPIGSVNSSNAETYIAPMKAVGWTPMGLAIRDGKNAFAGKEGQKNQIILVTDGDETCDSNPAGAASEAKASPYAIRVDVIGFAVKASEQSLLQAISQNGGGLFSVATNGDELLNQIKSNHANFENFQAGAKCAVDVYQKSISCLQDVNNKTFSYLTTLLTGKKGTEYQELSNLQLSISKIYNDKINTVQTEWNNAIKANQQILK